jgi:hypothetical protein
LPIKSNALNSSQLSYLYLTTSVMKFCVVLNSSTGSAWNVNLTSELLLGGKETLQSVSLEHSSHIDMSASNVDSYSVSFPTLYAISSSAQLYYHRFRMLFRWSGCCPSSRHSSRTFSHPTLSSGSKYINNLNYTYEMKMEI